MNAQINPPFNSLPPQHLDLNTLKQRRFQYKAARQNFTENSDNDTYQNHNNTMPLRTQQQESCLSDRAHHPGARTQAYTPMTPTYTRDTRDRSAPGFHETCNEQMFSEPLQHGILLTHNKNISPPLTPLKPSTMILLNDTNENDAESVDNEGSGTPKMHTLKRAPMTPEGRSYSDSSILRKDLISYRVARQMVRNPGSSAAILRSHSLRETSNSLERSNSEVQQRNTERSSTMFENDRRGHIMGLERFYNRNMQVLEEDEGHSDEFERENSREGKDATWRRRPMTSQQNVKARDNKGNYVNNKVRAQKKAGNVTESVDRKIVSERPNTANVAASRYMGKKDVKETVVKAGMGSSARKLEEQLQKNKLVQQKTFEEEQNVKTAIPQEDNASKARNLTPAAQTKPQVAPNKRLQLNNWARPAQLDSAHSSNRNSPRSRQKEKELFSQSQPIKKMFGGGDSSPKKAVESKVAKMFKKSTTVQIGNGKSGSSQVGTTVFDESEQIVNIVSSTVAAVNNTIAALNIKDNKDIKATSTTPSKVDVKTLKLPLSKDLHEKGDLSKLPLKSSETDRSRKKSQERESSVGKPGSTTRENTKRKESLVKVASEGSDQAGASTPANNNAKKTYTIVKKGVNDNNNNNINSSPMNKRKEASDAPKTPSRTIKHTGMSSTGNLKKMTEAVAASSSLGNNAMAHYLGKLKSPMTKPVKVEKSVDVSKESRGTVVNKQVAQPSKWSRSPKEARNSKQSIDFRNLDELKLPANIVENKARSMEMEGLSLHFIPEKDVKEIQQTGNKTAPRKASMDKKEEVKGKETEEIKKTETKTSPNLKVRPDLLKALGLPFLINGKNI